MTAGTDLALLPGERLGVAARRFGRRFVERAGFAPTGELSASVG